MPSRSRIPPAASTFACAEPSDDPAWDSPTRWGQFLILVGMVWQITPVICHTIAMPISRTDPLYGRWDRLVQDVVRHAEGQFVAVGSGTILSSSDGVNWVLRTERAFRSLYGVAYGNGTFVGTGWYGHILQSGPLDHRLEPVQCGHIRATSQHSTSAPRQRGVGTDNSWWRNHSGLFSRGKCRLSPAPVY